MYINKNGVKKEDAMYIAILWIEKKHEVHFSVKDVQKWTVYILIKHGAI